MDMFQLWSQLESRENYLNLCHNTIYKLYQFREEVHKCQFQTQEGKNRILKVIEESIEQMNLSKPRLYDQGGVDLKQRCVNELLQYLNQEEMFNDNNHLFQIIEEMNYKSENSQKKQKQSYNKKYFCRGYRQLRCQFQLNQNFNFIANDGRLYGFSNSHKLIKKFVNEQRNFNEINYLKHSEQFLMRFDKKMIIQNNKWEQLQTLEGHDKISSLIVNEDQKLIISGSKDKTIRFWKKDNSLWICSQTLITEFSVLSLSLNSDQTKLILCGTFPIILVVEYQLGNNQWVITQKLKVDINGEYVSFINNNQFMFHPQGIGLFQIFNYQKEVKQFIEGKLLMISHRQSRQGSVHYFNNETKVLILSYDFRIYIYHFEENGDYELLHQIKLKQIHCLKRFLHQNQLIVIKKNMRWENQIFLIQLGGKN